MRSPIPETPIPHALIKSGAALFALNQSDVPNSCVTAIVATEFNRWTGTETEWWTWLFTSGEDYRDRSFLIIVLTSMKAYQKRDDRSPRDAF